jgi:hypothetical protein
MKPRIPPPPPCFAPKVWAEYLLQCQQDKRAAMRPFANDGEYRPAHNFCRDCLHSHAATMQLLGRCQPDHFRRVTEDAA